jgi:pyruvate kinase
MLDIGVDWVALSFDQRPEDILLIQRLILAQPWPNTFPPEDNGQDRKA